MEILRSLLEMLKLTLSQMDTIVTFLNTPLFEWSGTPISPLMVILPATLIIILQITIVRFLVR